MSSLKLRYQRFWCHFELARAKLVAFRVAFFSLIGVDAFLHLAHAPRYGTGFNVPHIAALGGLMPGPSRPGMLLVYLLLAYAGIVIACGVATRALLLATTALYGYAYFISQLDSYQHTYLMFLLLVIACFVPWTAAGRMRFGTPQVHSWALRLLLVQVAIVYLWAAVAKMHPLWLDGTTLEQQVRAGWVRSSLEGIGFAAAAKLVLATELFLAAALLVRRLWPAALVVGLGFHAGVELTGFEIGRFSYFMFSFYILLIPDRALGWLSQRASAARWRSPWSAMAARASRAPAALWVVVLAASTGLVLLLPFAQAWLYAALVLVAAGVAFVAHGRKLAPVAGAHACACVAVLALCGVTEQAHDYYKFWGGSARRLGDAAGAKQAYEQLTRLSPDFGPGHYHLANIARSEGRLEDAVHGYGRAQAASPDDYRAFLAEAEIHDSARRGAQARAVGQVSGRLRGLELGRARAIARRWAGAGAAPAP